MSNRSDEEEIDSTTMGPEEKRFARLGKKVDKAFAKVEKKIQTWGLEVPATTGGEGDDEDDDSAEEDEEDIPSSGDATDHDISPRRARWGS